ncbi:hypothetical protein GGR79_003851 [Xanthomonas arboricola]|uniref:hypothetical protein n=1 Tax=Xanthomonas arboricola TaxID=56448 RepID=UPI001431D83D|nr:hypothetical protein [Xanthomonas arboricola]NJC32291.1 hypothetical protein [Xanthomonas arboricola]
MTIHILKQLVLPDRYERLVDHLGADIANILTSPSSDNVNSLRSLANEISSRNEGILVPVAGRTGIGKTTFVMNSGHWLPGLFAPSLQYNGSLDFESLVKAVKQHVNSLPANERRIVPINIDHRENAPPSDSELATLKRFLRTNAAGIPAMVFWPETSDEIAEALSKRYVDITGETSVPLPIRCQGPNVDSWQDIAKHTLSLSNSIENLEQLGVDPSDYNAREFPTLGAFLRRLSHDFNKQVEKLRADLELPVSIVIAFCSESADPGVLTHITSATRYGMLDSHALVSVTSQSQVGKWWSERRGLLTRAIVQLDAHAVCVTPTSAASAIRNFSDEMPLFDTVGYRRYGPARGVRDLNRSDLGRLLCKAELTRFEARGTPGDEAAAAFQLLAEQGFNLGKDKNLNGIMCNAVTALMRENSVPFVSATSEKVLPFCGLIPDNAFFFEDYVQCVEFTWRKGDFLASGRRSEVAQYILGKLQSYVRQLGWTTD